jgi:hypothetical protein
LILAADLVCRNSDNTCNSFLISDKICKSPSDLNLCVDISSDFNICRENNNYYCVKIIDDQCRLSGMTGYFGCSTIQDKQCRFSATNDQVFIQGDCFSISNNDSNCRDQINNNCKSLMLTSLSCKLLPLYLC